MPSARGIQKRSRTKQPQRTHLPRFPKRKSLPTPSVSCRVAYVYQPIPPGYIRLLTIDSSKGEPATYRLVPYQQKLAPKYDAVSYCWGEDLTSTLIDCDGSDLCIRKSLSVALPYLADRPKSARPLWIDAICLNQEDNDEKAIHVPLMHEIYKNAMRTIVWLGEPDEDTDVALDFMAEVISHLKNGGSSEDIDDFSREQEWKAIREYLRRPWFTRLWALQEFLLSKAIEILCSRKKLRVLKWQTVEKFLDLIRDHDLSTNLLDTPVQPSDFLNSIYVNISFVKAARVTLRELGFIFFPSLLGLMPNRGCHEPVDKIWALLGLLQPLFVAEIQRKNIIDYSDSAKRDYWKSYLAFMKLLYAWNVHEFQAAMLRMMMEHPRHVLLPSWCPDFSVNKLGYLSLRVVRSFRAGFQNQKEAGITRFTTELDSATDALSINGFCVDEVKSATCVYRCLCENAQVFEDDNWSCAHDQGDLEMHIAYVEEVHSACTNRKFFATSSGHLGLGPAKLEAGDKICVFTGTEALYVLRKSISHDDLIHGQEQQGRQGKPPRDVQETFSWIGEAYVRGLMYGEAFTADSRETERKLVIV